MLEIVLRVLRHQGQLPPSGPSLPVHHLVGIDRPVVSLQPQLTYVRGFHPLFNGTERPLTDHDLARLRLVAEPRREIYDAAMSGVFATMLEADLAKRCVA